MALERQSFENNNGAGIESAPLTREQVDETLRNITDFTEAHEFVSRELEKMDAAQKSGLPTEAGLKEYLAQKEKEFRKEMVG